MRRVQFSVLVLSTLAACSGEAPEEDYILSAETQEGEIASGGSAAPAQGPLDRELARQVIAQTQVSHLTISEDTVFCLNADGLVVKTVPTYVSPAGSAYFSDIRYQPGLGTYELILASPVTLRNVSVTGIRENEDENSRIVEASATLDIPSNLLPALRCVEGYAYPSSQFLLEKYDDGWRSSGVVWDGDR